MNVNYIPARVGDNRKTSLPSNRPETRYFLDLARSMYWVPNEVDLSKDRQDYETLSEPLKNAIDYILAFFSSMDTLVNDNIGAVFLVAFGNIPEIRDVYNFQVMIEDVHRDSYALQINEIISDPTKQATIFNSIEELPVIKKIAKWVEDTASDKYTIGIQLFRMACVEGIMFYGAFCIIFYLQQSGKMKGLCHANKLISRDESLHRDFFAHVYGLLSETYKITKEQAYDILDEVMELANEFNETAIPSPIYEYGCELSAPLLLDYQKLLADLLLEDIGFERKYNTKNPFPFMTTINFTTKTNFFEKKVTEYQMSGNVAIDYDINDDVDF